ncbi:MAG: hypothetical protein KKD44_26750 [Proteobacteria bacterium]|nr:hypothetical protein [Pseudomonadota bacterium]
MKKIKQIFFMGIMKENKHGFRIGKTIFFFMKKEKMIIFSENIKIEIPVDEALKFIKPIKDDKGRLLYSKNANIAANRNWEKLTGKENNGIKK